MGQWVLMGINNAIFRFSPKYVPIIDQYLYLDCPLSKMGSSIFLSLQNVDFFFKIWRNQWSEIYM